MHATLDFKIVPATFGDAYLIEPPRLEVKLEQMPEHYARVDFAAITRNTGYVERATTRTLANLIARAVWRLLRDPMTVAELLDQNTADIGTLALAPADIGRLKDACRGALIGGWAVGIQQARREARGIVAAAHAPRTLYVKRPVLNGEALAEWAKAQGFKTTLPAADLHVTVAYSKQPLDWRSVPPATEPLRVEGGRRTVTKLGDEGAVVLRFESPELQARWAAFREAGASWDYADYHPHVTLSFGGERPRGVEPYAGPLELGPEVFAPVDEGWKDNVLEFHLPGQHDQQSHAGDDARSTSEPGAFSPNKWRAMGMLERRKEWAKLSREEKDAAAAATTSIDARADLHLGDAERDWPDTGDAAKDIGAYVEELTELTTTEARAQLKDYGKSTLDQLTAAGVKPAEARELALEMTRMIAAQDVEAAGRTLGDHGVHHILQDQRLALDTLGQLPGFELTSDRAAALSIAVALHDSGYMTPPAGEFLDDMHGRWSAQYYMENYYDRVKGALGEENAQFVAQAIAAHDSTVVDWENQPELSAIAVADNMALFHFEKMPPMIRYIPANMKPLVALGQGRISLDAAKGMMRRNIEKSDLSPTLRLRMLAGVEEVTAMLPKFTVGMIGAKLESVSWSEDHPVYHITRHVSNEALSRVLDLGQKQFRKLAETYGQDPDEFLRTGAMTLKRGDRTLLEARIERAKMSALQFHLPGQHDQQSHAGGDGGGDKLPPGKQTLNVDPYDYEEGAGFTKPVQVLINPSHDELLRWAGRDVESVRYLRWGDNIMFWDAYSALHAQVLEAAEYAGLASEREVSATYKALEGAPGKFTEGEIDVATVRRDKTQQELFSRWIFHLPGQHDQQSHAGDSGSPDDEDNAGTGVQTLEVRAWRPTDEDRHTTSGPTRTLRVLVNPTKNEFLRWAGRDVRAVRGQGDSRGNYYFWDAGSALHVQVENALKEKGRGFGSRMGAEIPLSPKGFLAEYPRVFREDKFSRLGFATDLRFHLPGQHEQQSHAGGDADVENALLRLPVTSWDGKTRASIQVLKNPDATTLRRWAGREIKAVRYLLDSDSGDVYVWESELAMHEEIMPALGLENLIGSGGRIGPELIVELEWARKHKDVPDYGEKSLEWKEDYKRLEFHLPGQHDQQSHAGDEGGLPVTTPKGARRDRQETITVRSPAGAFKLNLLVNPTEHGLRRWAGREVEHVRLAIDDDTGDMFVWDANDAIHNYVFDALKASGLVDDSHYIAEDDSTLEQLAWKLSRHDMTRLAFAATDLREQAAGYFEANGFRMAQNLSDGARALIQQELVRAVRTGDTRSVVTGRIFQRLLDRGFTDAEAIETEVDDEEVLAELLDLDDPDAVPAYLNTLVRTNVFEAMNEARFAEYTDPALEGYVVALEYSAILDDNTTAFCEHMDGRTYSIDNPIWDTHRPPNHYNCRSVLIPLTRLSDWDGEESDPPGMEPAIGFSVCAHIEPGDGRSLADHRHIITGISGEASDRPRFHLPGQHDQQSHAGEGGKVEAKSGSFGQGWWYNSDLGKLVAMDPSELGPHGDHDGWIALADHAEELGIDPALARDVVNEYGHMEGDEYVQATDEEMDRGNDAIANLKQLTRVRYWPKNNFYSLTGSGPVSDMLRNLPAILNGMAGLRTDATVSLSGEDDESYLKIPVAEALSGNFNPRKYKNKYTRDEFHLPGQHDQQSHAGDDASVGQVLNTLPVLKSADNAQARNWRSKNEERYRTDPEFKAVVDAVTLFTQGEYDFVRGAAEFAETGELNPRIFGPSWAARMNEPISGSGMSEYKSYFESQGELHDGTGRATWREAGAALNRAVDSAPPAADTIYRGLPTQEAHATALALKPGDTFEIKAPVSFSASAEVASKFAAGRAGKGDRAPRESSDYQTVIEIEPGHPALNVSMLSPWRQQEVLARGKFKVVEVKVEPYEAQHRNGGWVKRERVRVRLRGERA